MMTKQFLFPKKVIKMEAIYPTMRIVNHSDNFTNSMIRLQNRCGPGNIKWQPHGYGNGYRDYHYVARLQYNGPSNYTILADYKQQRQEPFSNTISA